MTTYRNSGLYRNSSAYRQGFISTIVGAMRRRLKPTATMRRR